MSFEIYSKRKELRLKWDKRLRLFPFNILYCLKVFIIGINFMEPLIFHKDSIVGVNEMKSTFFLA